jgi:hypothetical protein
VLYRPSTYVALLRCSLLRAFVCGKASESTIIGLIIPESATGIVTTFDIRRFQGVNTLALTTLWKPWVFATSKIIETGKGSPTHSPSEINQAAGCPCPVR